MQLDRVDLSDMTKPTLLGASPRRGGAPTKYLYGATGEAGEGQHSVTWVMGRGRLGHCVLRTTYCPPVQNPVLNPATLIDGWEQGVGSLRQLQIPNTDEWLRTLQCEV